jgi:CPA2 family monovalent cation:H+ antiporter-2
MLEPIVASSEPGEPVEIGEAPAAIDEVVTPEVEAEAVDEPVAEDAAAVVAEPEPDAQTEPETEPETEENKTSPVPPVEPEPKG